MDALRLHGIGDLRLEQLPEPTPRRGEEVVRVTAVGLCGSDLHWYVDGGTGARITQPLVLGHEIGGVVESGSRAGLRVALEPSHACGHCEPCRAGHGNLCPNVRFAGHSVTDGGLRERMAWPGRLLLPVPDAIADDDVALLEPLGIALHAIDLAHLRPGRTAAVIGCGPVGLLLIRALRAIGAARIVATDRLQHRVDAALASGATEASLVSADGESPGSEGWHPVDVAFEVAGEDEALETALRLTRVGGRVVLVGIPGDGHVGFRAALGREKGLTLIMARRMKTQHLLRAIELVDDGLLEIGDLITARYPLHDGVAAFEALTSRAGLKVVIRPSALGRAAPNGFVTVQPENRDERQPG
jgi:L-iditol 2-dehydrogenase